MVHILYKISHKLKDIRSSYVQDKKFSKKLARYRCLLNLFSSVRLKKLAQKYRKKYDNFLINYFETKLAPLINKYKNDVDLGVSNTEAPIWVCWWTGVETAPDLVKQCIKSIYSASGAHKVYMITEKNYRDYVEIPEYMLEKVKNGTMKLAHLADYIRLSLLESYGGLWLDATIFCSRFIPDEYFKQPFFTCKSDWRECGYISYMQWVTFILGGWKGNVFFRFIKEAFEYYWRKENFAIDYLMFDYIIYVGYRNIPAIYNCIEQNNINNLNRDELQAAMNEALPAESFDSVIKEDTVLYKLSWREKYSLTTVDGEKSVYSHFLDIDL